MALNIMHVSAGNLYGGVEAMMLTFAQEERNFPELQHRFALCFEARLARELKQIGARLHFLGPVQTRFPWTILSARNALRKLLKSVPEKIDAVICHMAWSLAIFGPVVRRFKELPLVFWLHDALNGKHWLERWAGMTRPNLVICNSQFTASTLNLLFKDVPFEIVRAPVSKKFEQSDQKRGDVRAELHTVASACVVVQVARLEPYKGHALLLQALSQVPGNWVLWLVGGAQRPQESLFLEELKTLAEQLKITDKVRFLGERKDVPLLMQAADLFCQPNLRAEPFGIVFIEALYAGLPLVTTDVGGGGSEIVDATCGLLTKPGDPESLAQALNELISDPKRRKELGAAGPARAHSFCDPEKVIANIAALIRKL